MTCGCPPVPTGPRPQFSPGIFRMGHVFQRGDLPLYVTDPAGNPMTPYSVKFTMWRYAADSPNPIQIGPADRTPTTVGVGEYYVTGIAGECGTPAGDWFVVWKLQETSTSPETSVTRYFKIFSTSQYCLPTCCSATYGWD